MKTKRIFKTKTFSRWAKGILSDEQLCVAAKEIMQGLYEADLGSGLCKKRIAIPGRGKRGSTRTLVAKGTAAGIFFIVGRQKSDSGADFSSSQVDAAKLIGSALQRADVSHIEGLVSDGVLKEICNENHQ